MRDIDFVDNDPLKEEQRSAARTAIIVFGSIIYLLGLAFTLAHSWNLLIAPVASEVKWIATLGVVALELNAIALPLAIHFWTRGTMHRSIAILFYALDIIMLYMNSNIDVHMLRGASLSPMMQWYREAFSQVSPIYTVVVWAVLYATDPAERAREKMTELVTHARMAALKATTDWLQSEEFKNTIRERGGELGESVLHKAFNGTTIRVKPHREEDEQEEEINLLTSSNGNGKIGKSKRNFTQPPRQIS